MEDNKKKEQYTTDELLELLRKKVVFQVADIEFAVLKATGDLSVMLKKENQSLTAKNLNLSVPSIKEPQTVIMDGESMDKPLSTIGRSVHGYTYRIRKIRGYNSKVYSLDK